MLYFGWQEIVTILFLTLFHQGLKKRRGFQNTGHFWFHLLMKKFPAMTLNISPFNVYWLIN